MAENSSAGIKRFLVLFAAVASVILVGLLLLLPNSDPPDQHEPVGAGGWTTSPATPSLVEPSKAPVEIGEPIRLVVYRIGVEAPVIALGFADDGSQAVPETLHETAWWELGARPGQAGNGVIVGHAASRADGVFDRLGELVPGDRVKVFGSDGEAEFEVTGTEELPVEDFSGAADDIYRTDGDPGLVLMTCGGWNGEAWTSTTVVRAFLLR